jgi:hypothetical protein
MMSLYRRVVAAAVLGAVVAVSGPVSAEQAEVQFAADMVRRGPDGQAMTGKMYVGDDRIRMEMSQKGREMVRISDQKRGTELVLFPAEKAYLERSSAPGAAPAAPPPAKPSAEADPCVGMAGMTCRRVGTEAVNGRPAVKWEMTMTDQGKTMTATQWLDAERGLPTKQVLPNGQTMEMKLLGTESIEGRKAEKWERTAAMPNQPPMVTLQWYDPELKLALREEFPGGYVTEIKNIRIGPQADELFVVPAGYTKKALPQGGPPPGPGPGPGGQPQPGGN